jgi:hypothetical protein
MAHSFRCGLRCAAPPGLWEFWGDDDPQLSLWATVCRPSGAIRKQGRRKPGHPNRYFGSYSMPCFLRIA